MGQALSDFPIADKLAPWKSGVEAFAEGIDRPFLAQLSAQSRRASDVVANLRENAAPFFKLRSEGSTVQRHRQGAIGDPRPDELDRLFGLRNAVRHFQFKERFGIVKVGHFNGSLNYAHAESAAPPGAIKSRIWVPRVGARRTATSSTRSWNCGLYRARMIFSSGRT